MRRENFSRHVVLIRVGPIDGLTQLLKGKMMGSEKNKLTSSEKKVLRRIRRWRQNSNQRYDFWFTYVLSKCDCCGSKCYIAVGYEGGVDLPPYPHFRNQYSIQYRKPLIKNWD